MGSGAGLGKVCFVVINPCVSANRVDLEFFFVSIFPFYSPLPPAVLLASLSSVSSAQQTSLLRSLKTLSSDPSTLSAFEAAEAIPTLIGYLENPTNSTVRLSPSLPHFLCFVPQNRIVQRFKFPLPPRYLCTIYIYN